MSRKPKAKMILSPEAEAVVTELKRGGCIRVAGLTRTRYVVWRGQEGHGPAFGDGVVRELLDHGLLTKGTLRLRWKAVTP